MWVRRARRIQVLPRLTADAMTTPLKLLIGVLLALLVLLQAALWGRQGVLDLWQLQRLNLAGASEVKELKARNRALEHKVASMKSGPEAVEAEAREELGMIRRGETFFRVIGPAPETPAP